MSKPTLFLGLAILTAGAGAIWNQTLSNQHHSTDAEAPGTQGYSRSGMCSRNHASSVAMSSGMGDSMTSGAPVTG
jgi:hypothetical protein